MGIITDGDARRLIQFQNWAEGIDMINLLDAPILGSQKDDSLNAESKEYKLDNRGSDSRSGNTDEGWVGTFATTAN